MTAAEEIARLCADYDKRLEEYAAENAALRDRIKGERMSYLAECKYKEEIADLAFKLGAAEAVIVAARKWYAIQRGTMAAMSPSGVALRETIDVYDAR